VLSSKPMANATWELTSVDSTSISFVVDRILKVSTLHLEFGH
jgi:hypothetical protein